MHLHISESVFWPIGETSLNLSWPRPIPRNNQWIVIQSFGDLSGDVEKSTDGCDTIKEKIMKLKMAKNFIARIG